MIDNEGYRLNVGIVICNKQGQLLWARRCGQNSWQFPQGGIKQGEKPEDAMYRELFEEVGLQPNDVKLLAVNDEWLRYKLPKRMVRTDTNPICIGQKQLWFLLQLISEDDKIRLTAATIPEFDDWGWVSYWYPIRQVVSFKKEVYRKMLKKFLPFMMQLQEVKVKPLRRHFKKRNGYFARR